MNTPNHCPECDHPLSVSIQKCTCGWCLPPSPSTSSAIANHRCHYQLRIPKPVAVPRSSTLQQKQMPPTSQQTPLLRPSRIPRSATTTSNTQQTFPTSTKVDALLPSDSIKYTVAEGEKLPQESPESKVEPLVSEKSTASPKTMMPAEKLVTDHQEDITKQPQHMRLPIGATPQVVQKNEAILQSQKNIQKNHFKQPRFFNPSETILEKDELNIVKLKELGGLVSEAIDRFREYIDKKNKIRESQKNTPVILALPLVPLRMIRD